MGLEGFKMSSNIRIQRICEHCNEEFTAKTTVTRLCSPKCRKASYKERKRTEKIEGAKEETQRIKNRPLEELQVKEFLTVKDVSTLIGCSVDTVYRMIDNDTIKAVNLAQRVTRVKRSELNKLFEWQQK